MTLSEDIAAIREADKAKRAEMIASEDKSFGRMLRAASDAQWDAIVLTGKRLDEIEAGK